MALSGVAVLVLIVLGVALYVGGVFNSTGSSSPAAAPAGRVDAGSNPASPPTTTTPPQVTTTAASTTPPPPAPGPAQVLRTHLQDIGSGNYKGAFHLMSSSYQSKNPSWPSERSAADPGMNIVSIGTPQYTSGGANVQVDFFARDRQPTAGSDTQCREFQGTAHLIKQGGSWRYDPSGSSLNATVATGDSHCPS